LASILRHIAVVRTLYYTDPLCPWSWAFEPIFRRLLWEFDGELEIEYVMSGMRRELEDPEQIALQALEASAQSRMPVDARLWLSDPPGSSHPSCIAVRAAAEQGVADPYLRRLREAVFCRRHNPDNADALVEEGRQISGLDLDQFRIDLRSHATLEAFGADLDRAERVPPEHHAEGSERVKLPSLEFRGPGDQLHGVYGITEYDEVRKAALAAGATRSRATPPSIEEALRRFVSMATIEFSAVCQLPAPPATAELWRLAGDWRITAEPVLGGELWSLPAGG
jgi:predicted DsbA family dithiol-disulfide isomerase